MKDRTLLEVGLMDAEGRGVEGRVFEAADAKGGSKGGAVLQVAVIEGLLGRTLVIRVLRTHGFLAWVCGGACDEVGEGTVD